MPVGTTLIVSPTAADDVSIHETSHMRVVFNRETRSLTEPRAHLHTASTEVYLVVAGTLTLEVESERIVLASHQACTIPPGVPHRILESSEGVEAVVIRSPAIADRIPDD